MRILDSPTQPDAKEEQEGQVPSPLNLTDLGNALSQQQQQQQQQQQGPDRSSRSSAYLQSSRPAPPSPALSRRGSEINASGLLLGSPTLSVTHGRDRASSTGSSSGSTAGLGGSAATRRMSQSSALRGSGRARPRSSLGINAFSADSKEYADSIAQHGATSEGDETPAAGASTPHGLLASPLITARSGPSSPKPLSVPEEPAAPAPPQTSGTDEAELERPQGGDSQAGESADQAMTEDAPLSQDSSDDKPAILIKDYAYPPSDQRHFGIYPKQPPSSRRDSSSSSRRDSTSPSSHRRSASASKKGWTGLSLLGWRFLGRGAEDRRSSATAEEEPQIYAEPDEVSEPDVGSTTDDYAFASSSSSSDLGDDEVSSRQGLARGGYYGDSGLSELSDDEGHAGGAGPGLPDTPPYGLYRAAYAFDAEGENEMTVAEGEVIDVRGRGGGEGWVIASRLPSTRSPTGLDEGLVPESYLDKLSDAEAAAHGYDPSRYSRDNDDSFEELDDDQTPRQEKKEEQAL